MIGRHFYANLKVQTAMCKDNNNSKSRAAINVKFATNFSFCETAESRNKIHAFDTTVVRGRGMYEKLVNCYKIKSIVMF